MSFITEFALKNSRFTILATFMLVITGIAVFLNYPSREDPSITIRNAQVTTQFPGMSPERIEDLITRPLEEKIREIPEVDDIKSDSKSGVSFIKIELKDNVADLNPVWQDLRDKMSDIAPSLPSGTVGPFVNDQVGLTAVATVALWADGFDLSEMDDIVTDIRDRLYALNGIKKVEVFGQQEERIFLDFSQTKIAQFGVSPEVIVSSLQSQNIILPGGDLEASGQSVILEPSGNFNSVEEISKTLIQVPNTGQVLQLDDLVTVRRAYEDPPSNPVYFNNKPALILSISIVDGVNSIAFGKELKTKTSELQQTLPWGYVLEFATFQPDLVDTAVNGAVNNLYQTLAIVLGVVILFLGLRTGLIVGAFLPVTMLMSIIIMRYFEVELQRVSIAAMIIALGMLVDNGIVIAEDIRVRFSKGEERSKAAINAGKSLAIPLLTSSLTTILFFVPMALSEGGASEFTGSLAQVVTIVLLCSWFLSLFLTPVMCVWFMKTNPSSSEKNENADTETDSKVFALFTAWYKRMLIGLLRFKYLFVASMIGLLLVSGYAFTKLGQEFFPLGERNQYLVYLDLPAQTSVNKTNEVTRRLLAWLSDPIINPEIKNSIGYISSGGPRFFLSLSSMDPDPNRSFVLVNTHDPKDVRGLVSRTRKFMLDALPEVRGEAKEMWMGPSEAGLFELRIIGSDADILNNQAERIVQTLYDIPGTLIAKHNWDNRIAKIKVNVDQARARQAGISSEELANALNTFFSGTNITDFRSGEDIIPIVLISNEEDRGTLSGLQDLVVYSSSKNKWIPLIQFATIKGAFQPSRIKRENQERTITVSSKGTVFTPTQLMEKLSVHLEEIDQIAGLRWEAGGELESQNEAVSNLFGALPACVAVIIVLLVLQFNSIRRPLIIFLTIPLIIIGATLGLVIMKGLFGFMVLLGLFSLAGIIINNGIVLIDRIDSEMQNHAPFDALVTACLARLRPIVMTTVTTVLGLIPLILSQDALFYAMACAIAFGLAVGTVFTLGVVPILYSIFFRISYQKH